MSIESKVEEWNTYYKAWGKRERFKDLSAKDYGEGVAYALLDICKGDLAQAIEVLQSVERSQKFYHGDALDILERLSGTANPKEVKEEDADEDDE